jgi:hypothetical protein
MTISSACPGCGAIFDDMEGPTHAYMESSPGCWAAFCEVLAREYSNPGLFDVHRLSVDAYAVQHPGKPSRQSIQSVTLHLLRLHLQLERGLRPERANDAMLALSEHKATFVWLEPPASRGSVTVAEVVPCVEVEAHRAAVSAWARSALSAWSLHRGTLDRWLEKVARGG